MLRIFKRRAKLAEECRCPCHNVLQGQQIVHIAPCCSPCPHYFRNIVNGQMQEHTQEHHEKKAS